MQGWIKQFIKRDFWYILVLCLALCGCIYTMYHVDAELDKCNDAWQEFVDEHCACSLGSMNLLNLSLLGDWGGIENAKNTTKIT